MGSGGGVGVLCFKVIWGRGGVSVISERQSKIVTVQGGGGGEGSLIGGFVD